jgi:hypothetical protein
VYQFIQAGISRQRALEHRLIRAYDFLCTSGPGRGKVEKTVTSDDPQWLRERAARPSDDRLELYSHEVVSVAGEDLC